LAAAVERSPAAVRRVVQPEAAVEQRQRVARAAVLEQPALTLEPGPGE